MRFRSKLLSAAALVTVFPIGCQSHQARMDALQKQYDDLAAQFHKDCSAEYLKVPPTISQKCTDEDRQVQEAYKQLQNEKTKQ